MLKINDREDRKTLIIRLDSNGLLSYAILKQYFLKAIRLVYNDESGEEIAILSFLFTHNTFKLNKFQI